MNQTIRDAFDRDIEAITQIYNALIPTTTIAWTEELQTVEERAAWFARQQQQQFPVLVSADDQTGEVVGFASYGHFRGAGVWPGYRFTVEHTIHVRQHCWQQGVGRQLMKALIARATAANIHVMVGALDAQNTASLAFHQRIGFIEVARMPEIGFKHDRWLDLVLVQRILGSSDQDGSDPDGS